MWDNIHLHLFLILSLHWRPTNSRQFESQKNRLTVTISQDRMWRRFWERWKRTKKVESQQVCAVVIPSRTICFLGNFTFRQMQSSAISLWGAGKVVLRKISPVFLLYLNPQLLTLSTEFSSASCNQWIAGFESTVAILRLCCLELVNHPDVQTKLQNEIYDEIGERVCNWTKKSPIVSHYLTNRFSRIYALSLARVARLFVTRRDHYRISNSSMKVFSTSVLVHGTIIWSCRQVDPVKFQNLTGSTWHKRRILIPSRFDPLKNWSSQSFQRIMYEDQKLLPYTCAFLQEVSDFPLKYVLSFWFVWPIHIEGLSHWERAPYQFCASNNTRDEYWR